MLEGTHLHKASGLKGNVLCWHNKLHGRQENSSWNTTPPFHHCLISQTLLWDSYTKITLHLRVNNFDILESLLVKLCINFHVHLNYTGNIIQSMKYWLGKHTRRFNIICNNNYVRNWNCIVERTFVLRKGHWLWTFLSLT